MYLCMYTYIYIQLRTLCDLLPVLMLRLAATHTQQTAIHCNALHHTATYCSATVCNTLQHVAGNV